jgi:hypothetical protein
MREYPVRICEGLGVKFPGPTRRVSTVGRAGRGLPNRLSRMSRDTRTVAPHYPWVFTDTASYPGRLDKKLNWRNRCHPQ